MPSNRWSEDDRKCATLWRLARSHGWANWIPGSDLIRAVPSHERGAARSTLDALRGEPYVAYQPRRGYSIAHDAIDRLATTLRDLCGDSEFRIEATLSHFGGF